MAARKRSEHYVNNKEFLYAIVQYKKDVKDAEEAGQPKPRITNYLGECFLKIATHLSYKPNFVNYMFREDMICDGIENCVQYIHNFNPEKSTNPFAYFTQIIHYAFLRRIQKEKKQMEIRTKILEKSGYDEVFTVDDDYGSSFEYNSIKDAIQSKMKEASILAKANSNSSKLDQEKNLFELQKRNLTKDLATMEENKQKSEQMHDRLKFLKNVT